MGIEQKLGDMGVVTTTLENVVNWSRTNAMWPMLFGLVEMVIFIVILLVGYIYAWKKGALEWE